MRRLRCATARRWRKDDLVASDLIYPNRRGETYSVKYNPNHRWFYFPEMTADEALLLKCYDSADDGRTRFGPHTAFTDPDHAADAAAAREHRAPRAGVSPGVTKKGGSGRPFLR